MRICNDNYHNCVATNPFDDCEFVYTMCLGACSDSYTHCANQNCGPTGGGGMTCDGASTGYSRTCANERRAHLNDCLSGGSSGVIVTYQACMTWDEGSAEREYCCNQQINDDIREDCVCQLDSRNPDCVCNP
jgi:hypothetical protein